MGVPRDALPGALPPGSGGLRAELTEALRTGRARRRRKGPNPGRGTRGKLTDTVPISERPPEVEDRAVPGHWEGDLILGRAGKSQIATIVERTTRFTLLVRLPDDRKARRCVTQWRSRSSSCPSSCADR